MTNTIEKHIANRTELHRAVIQNNTEEALELLKQGADPEAKDSFKRTPLHYAVKNSNLEIVKELIDTQYERSQIFYSIESFFSIQNHGRKLRSFLKGKNGDETRKRYCSEYINTADAFEQNVLRYTLTTDHPDNIYVQIYLLDHGAELTEEKPSIVESSILHAIQIYTSARIASASAMILYEGLKCTVRGIDRLIGCDEVIAQSHIVSDYDYLSGIMSAEDDTRYTAMAIDRTFGLS